MRSALSVLVAVLVVSVIGPRITALFGLAFLLLLWALDGILSWYQRKLDAKLKREQERNVELRRRIDTKTAELLRLARCIAAKTGAART